MKVNKMEFNSLIPELSVSNIETSRKFYEDIGFKLEYERKEDKFCFMSLEKNQIMLQEQNDNWTVGKMEYPFGRGINISMRVKDVEKMYEALKQKNIKMYLDLEVHHYRADDTVYDDREFLIQDPDGYLLRFND
jgi:catechol 2,3-dioxygenase-like lactoylglutathione lyase family enzyme